MAYRFFSIIHTAIIEDGELALPEKFVEKFGRELSDVAVISIPTGKVWRVQLREANGNTLFGKGWKKFMDYFPLDVGHFLVFEYDGNSHFRVFVCGMTASEIKYPLYTSNAERSVSRKSVFPAAATEETGCAENLKVYCPCPISFIPSPAKKETNGRAGRNTNTNAFKSQSGNPTFKIVMQPTYVCRNSTVVHVPVGFKVFREVKRDFVTLRNSKGKTWNVGVSTYGYKLNHSKLGAGWSDFVFGNHLEVDDVCIFELIDRDNLKMDVTIIRARDVV